MRLDTKAFALTLGILWGLCVLVCTLWVVARGGGEHLELLGKFYLGYTVTPVGAFVGLLYGFVDGLIGGFLFAWLYNRLAKA